MSDTEVVPLAGRYVVRQCGRCLVRFRRKCPRPGGAEPRPRVTRTFLCGFPKAGEVEILDRCPGCAQWAVDNAAALLGYQGFPLWEE